MNSYLGITKMIFALLLTVCVFAGCGSKEIKISEEEMQEKVDQMTDEERYRMEQNQEAVGQTTQSIPVEGMSEERMRQVQEGIQVAIPGPPPAQ